MVTFKVIQFNRNPKNGELQNLKWASEDNDDGKTSILKNISNKGLKEIKYMLKQESNDSKLRFYAFLKAVNKDAGVATKILLGEIILIAGTEQHSQTYGNKLMFPAQALREVKKNYPTHKHATIIIFKDAYTEMQLNIIKKDARSWNKTLYFKKINSAEELVNYINKGDATINRSTIKVETIKIF